MHALTGFEAGALGRGYPTSPVGSESTQHSDITESRQLILSTYDTPAIFRQSPPHHHACSCCMSPFSATADSQPGLVELDSAADALRITHHTGTASLIPLDAIAFVKRLPASESDEQLLRLVSLTNSGGVGDGERDGRWPTASTLDVSVPAGSDFVNHPRISHLLLNPKLNKVSIISNAHAGARSAPQTIERLITPLLDLAGVGFSVHHTKAEGDAGALAAQLVNDGARTLVLAGGDGTVGEVVNGLLLGEDGQVAELGVKVGLIVV